MMLRNEICGGQRAINPPTFKPHAVSGPDRVERKQFRKQHRSAEALTENIHNSASNFVLFN